MSKREMCPYLKNKKNGMKTLSGYCHEGLNNGCPPNTNSKCEIVKPKSRYKTIKARFVIDANGELWASPWVLSNEHPCEIRIDRKHLGGK